MPRAPTCHVYKRRRKRGGRVRVAGTYTARVGLPGEPCCEFNTETADKRVAEQRARERLVELERERAGIIAPRAQREAAETPLRELLASYVADLRARGKADMYAYNVDKRVGRLLDACKWRRLRDVTPQSFQEWRGLQTKSAAKTVNDYLGAARAFVAWLIAAGRCEADPLRGVGKVDARGRKSRERRALSVEEQQSLLRAAPFERRVVYLAALLTGLRRNELASLVWADLVMGSEGDGLLKVRAHTTKNARHVVVRVRADLGAMLMGLRPKGVSQAARMFRVPPMREVYADYAAAGVPKLDELGRRVDLHALRGTFITNGGNAGVSPRVLQEAARHSDPRLTAGVYTDSTKLATEGVVDALPRYAGLMDGSIDRGGGTLEGTLERDAGGRFVSRPVVNDSWRASSEVPANQGLGRDEAECVAIGRDGEASRGSRIRT